MLHLGQDSALPSPRVGSQQQQQQPAYAIRRAYSPGEHDDGAELEGSRPQLAGGGFGLRIGPIQQELRKVRYLKSRSLARFYMLSIVARHSPGTE